MKKSKITVESSVLDKIVNSKIITQKEKLYYLKYIWYLKSFERLEFIKLR